MSFTFDNWRAGVQRVSAEIDNVFGERIILVPCLKRPNFTQQLYIDNAVELLGVFSLRADVAFKRNMFGGANSHGGAELVETRDPIVSFSHRALPWPLQHGDVVRRCASGEEYEIKSIEPDGTARVTCHLVQLGRQSQQ